MKHFSKENWLLYIKDELAEPNREEFEDHLFSCDQCLKVYTVMLDTYTEEQLEIKNKDFTDEVIAKLPLHKKKQKKSFLQSPMFHYGVAAVVTFTLMTTGVFQSVIGIVGSVEASAISNQEPTVSDSIMEKALSIFDIIELKQKEGQK